MDNTSILYYTSGAAIMDTGLQRKSWMRQCLNLFSLLISPSLPTQNKRDNVIDINPIICKQRQNGERRTKKASGYIYKRRYFFNLESNLKEYNYDNGYVFGVYDGDIEPFINRYVAVNSSCFVKSAVHNKERVTKILKHR